MDTGENRGYRHGGGRRGRGRHRGRASRNHYFEPHYDQYQNEGEQYQQYDNSQKEESYHQSSHNYRGRSRGRGRGGRRPRGGYRNHRGGRGYGGHYNNQPYEEEKKNTGYQKKHNNNPVRFEHNEYHRRERDQAIATQEEVDDARVYYQAEDFLKKYDGLPEKTEYLVKELCEATIQ